MTRPRLAGTPEPPYTAVIFTSLRSDVDDGYAEAAAQMERLAARQPGYLGIEEAREGPPDGLGITVSYWLDDAAARAWKQVAEHRLAQQRGRTEWYRDYRVRVATVEREYPRSAPEPDDTAVPGLAPDEPTLPGIPLTVAGEDFELRARPRGQYHVTWLSGPNPGYGFGWSRSDGAPSSPADIEEMIQEFLNQIDPETGYL